MGYDITKSKGGYRMSIVAIGIVLVIVVVVVLVIVAVLTKK